MIQVGIIGAGITGLSAAFHLRKAGLSVAIYDSAERAGGVICSFRRGSWLAEGGPNTLLETDPKIGELIDDLGLTGRRLYSDPKAGARYVVRGGRPVLLPASGLQFLCSPLFSTRAKLRLLAEPFIRRGMEEESVADFVRRRLGQEFLDYAIDPLVTGIYAGDPAALSVRHAFPRIHDLESRYGSLIRGQILGARERRRRGGVSKANAPKLSFDEGLQVLPDTLQARLGDSLRLGTTIEEVSKTPPAWRVACRRPDGVFQVDHRAVLFCGTALSLARLVLTAPGVQSMASLSSISYPPVTSVVLGFRRADVAHPCQGFGVLIPKREGFDILGTIFSSSLFPGRAPPDHLTLTTYVGGARGAETTALDDDQLVERVTFELGRLFGIRGRPVHQSLTRWPHAIPQYNLGYGRHKALLDAVEAGAPGFFVAGHFRDGVALSDSILAGRRAADRIAAHLSKLAMPHE